MNGRNLLDALDYLNSIGVDVNPEDFLTLKPLDELDAELRANIEEIEHLLYEELECSINQNNI